MRSFHISILLTLVFLFAAAGYCNGEEECEYTIYVKTGSVENAGTDAKITMTLSNKTGQALKIPNLEKWGLMGPGWDYFENSNLDIFRGTGRCISDICLLNLISDGTGKKPGWYCDTVEITSRSTATNQGGHKTFYVYQWLAVDEPSGLTATVDDCYSGKFVVANDKICAAVAG